MIKRILLILALISLLISLSYASPKARLRGCDLTHPTPTPIATVTE